MALVTCPDCGKSISDAASACVHCGRPAPINRDDSAQVSLEKGKVDRDEWLKGAVASGFVTLDSDKPAAGSAPGYSGVVAVAVAVLVLFFMVRSCGGEASSAQDVENCVANGI